MEKRKKRKLGGEKREREREKRKTWGGAGQIEWAR